MNRLWRFRNWIYENRFRLELQLLELLDAVPKHWYQCAERSAKEAWKREAQLQEALDNMVFTNRAEDMLDEIRRKGIAGQIQTAKSTTGDFVVVVVVRCKSDDESKKMSRKLSAVIGGK